jgi:hypothetical protein
MTIDLNWHYQVWIGTDYYGALTAVYHYSNCSLGDAVSRAQRQYWDDHDYPDREPRWNDPEDIDFYPSLVQRSRSEFIEIYSSSLASLGIPDSHRSIDDAIKEENECLKK